jgi:hypothetical protein
MAQSLSLMNVTSSTELILNYLALPPLHAIKKRHLIDVTSNSKSKKRKFVFPLCTIIKRLAPAISPFHVSISIGFLKCLTKE